MSTGSFANKPAISAAATSLDCKLQDSLRESAAPERGIANRCLENLNPGTAKTCRCSMAPPDFPKPWRAVADYGRCDSPQQLIKGPAPSIGVFPASLHSVILPALHIYRARWSNAVCQEFSAARLFSLTSEFQPASFFQAHLEHPLL